MCHTLNAAFLLVLSFEACVGDVTDDKSDLMPPVKLSSVIKECICNFYTSWLFYINLNLRAAQHPDLLNYCVSSKKLLFFLNSKCNLCISVR